MRAITRLVAFLALLAVGDAAAQETRLVPVTVDGESVRLEMRVYTPARGERVPTLVFNHGSTGGASSRPGSRGRSTFPCWRSSS